MIGPKLRFEIFRRDNFTCQYCGRRSPDVILYLDHHLPRDLGGTDCRSNLVTACECCNLGKSNRLLPQTPGSIPLTTREAAAFLLGRLSAGVASDPAKAKIVALESVIVLRRMPDRVDEDGLRRKAEALLGKWLTEQRCRAGPAMEAVSEQGG